MPDSLQTWMAILREAPWLMPSLFGGIVGFFRRCGHRAQSGWEIAGRFALHLAVSGLNGYIVIGLASEVGLSAGMTGAACAIAGYLGGSALDMVEDIVRRRAARL